MLGSCWPTLSMRSLQLHSCGRGVGGGCGDGGEVGTVEGRLHIFEGELQMWQLTTAAESGTQCLSASNSLQTLTLYRN